MLLALAGRDGEAIALLRANEARMPQFLIRQFSVSLRALLEGDRDGCLAAIGYIEQADYADPEGLVLLARYLSRLGEQARARQAIEAAVGQGFVAVSFLRSDPWLAPLRRDPAFVRAMAAAARRQEEAAAAYAQAGGPELLGA